MLKKKKKKKKKKNCWLTSPTAGLFQLPRRAADIGPANGRNGTQLAVLGPPLPPGLHQLPSGGKNQHLEAVNHQDIATASNSQAGGFLCIETTQLQIIEIIF